jgi:undecaprenyl diphosphate synthase
VAIIPDGNRRWAAGRGLSSSEGHREGGKNFREISDAAFKLGVKYFTFWVASEDNLLKRNPLEIKFLVSLFKEELESEETLRRCREGETRLRVLGRWNEILENRGLRNAVASIEDSTRHFDKHCLTLLFGYDGRRELLEAIKNICEKTGSGAKPMPLPPDWINMDTVTNTLWTGSLPPVDLVIRSGEDDGDGWAHYSSGFMMWTAADAKVFFTEKPWPDFSRSMFHEVISDYNKSRRRFGA